MTIDEWQAQQRRIKARQVVYEPTRRSTTRRTKEPSPMRDLLFAIALVVLAMALAWLTNQS